MPEAILLKSELVQAMEEAAKHCGDDIFISKPRCNVYSHKLSMASVAWRPGDIGQLAACYQEK